MLFMDSAIQTDLNQEDLQKQITDQTLPTIEVLSLCKTIYDSEITNGNEMKGITKKLNTIKLEMVTHDELQTMKNDIINAINGDSPDPK